MINASVYIIALDEEMHIMRVLESVKEFAEIIIVDSGSTDKTLEIARKYTSKIYFQKWLGFSAQKEFAKNLCTYDWVLNLDADEELSKVLKQEIINTIEDNACDGLDIKINIKALDAFNHPLTKFGRRIRFFKKSNGHYPEKLVHESIVLDGKVRKAKGFILDYGAENLSIRVDKLNAYSSLRTKEKLQSGKKASLLKLALVFPLSFFKTYILKRHILNGFRGFISSMNSAYYAFLKEAKLYEAQSKKQ